MSHRPDIAREIVLAELGRLARAADQKINVRVTEALDGLVVDFETEHQRAEELLVERDSYREQAQSRDEECEAIRDTIRRWVESENDATHYHVHDPTCPHCVVTSELVAFA